MESTQTAPGVRGQPNGASGSTSDSGVAARSGPSPIVRTVLIVVGAIVVIAALIAGIRYLIYASSHQTTDDAKIDADQVQITSKISERVGRILVDTNASVRKGQLLIELDNQDEQTKLQSALAARDAQRSQAQAAQSTVSLTRDQQSAQNQQANGAIDQARASISGASDQARSAQQQIAVAQAGVAGASAQLDAAQAAVPGALETLRKAQADLRRTSSLVATGDVARAELDSANAAEQVAQSGYDQARANVAAAQANVESAQQKMSSQIAQTSGAQATIAVNQGTLVSAEGKLAESSAPSRVAAEQSQAAAALAQVATANAQVKTAQDNLSYTEIHSPIDGYVGQKNVEVGQTVSPGTSLITIVPSNNIYITANFKETQMGNIRNGQPVDVSVDAYHGVNFHGVVETISPASQNLFALVPAQNASGNFVKVTQRVPIRVRFVDPDPKYPLRPGMSVETSVKVK